VSAGIERLRSAGEAVQGGGEVALADDGAAVGGAGDRDVEVVPARRGLDQDPAVALDARLKTPAPG
jgi:hypothetical protein